jgi:hypothetical protein
MAQTFGFIHAISDDLGSWGMLLMDVAFQEYQGCFARMHSLRQNAGLLVRPLFWIYVPASDISLQFQLHAAIARLLNGT